MTVTEAKKELMAHYGRYREVLGGTVQLDTHPLQAVIYYAEETTRETVAKAVGEIQAMEGREKYYIMARLVDSIDETTLLTDIMGWAHGHFGVDVIEMVITHPEVDNQALVELVHRHITVSSQE